MPPHSHGHVDALFRAARPATVTVEDPGAPRRGRDGHARLRREDASAAIAAATCRLLGDTHIPKGMTLTLGLESWTVAAAALDGPGRTTSVDGALPIEHVSHAPRIMSFGMVRAEVTPAEVRLSARELTTL